MGCCRSTQNQPALPHSSSPPQRAESYVHSGPPNFLAGIILAPAKFPEPQIASFLHPAATPHSSAAWPLPWSPGPPLPASLGSFLMPGRSAPPTSQPFLALPLALLDSEALSATPQHPRAPRPSLHNSVPPVLALTPVEGSLGRTGHGGRAPAALPGQRHHAGPQHPNGPQA